MNTQTHACTSHAPEESAQFVISFSSKRIIHIVCCFFFVFVLTHCHSYYVRFSASYIFQPYFLFRHRVAGRFGSSMQNRKMRTNQISAVSIFIFAVCEKQNDKLIHFDGCRLSGNPFFSCLMKANLCIVIYLTQRFR